MFRDLAFGRYCMYNSIIQDNNIYDYTDLLYFDHSLANSRSRMSVAKDEYTNHQSCKTYK